MATWKDSSEIVLANVIGSNIANICLILGAASVMSSKALVIEILTAAGFRVVCLQNPLTAPSILFETKPALIWLDLLMPQINGYQLCSLLRQVTALKNTPIIFLTAKEGIIDRLRAKMVGANSYLSKPITAEELLKAISKEISP